MNELLELEFKGRRTEYALNPLQYPFQRGDLAIVTTDRGQDLGKVSHIGIRPGDSPDAPTLTILRKARSLDVEKLTSNRDREADAKRVARGEIIRHKLEMKLVDVELQWDGRKMTFYFTSEGRVDFRDLVRDLATKFRTRIDLRQIGARDETKKVSGYGVCGRSLCCATFLTEFKPITTQMPRDQFLPLNPSKLSGVCGRLKCCLRYELDTYKEFQRECPKVGHPIKDDEKGMGEVDKLDVVREQIQVRYGNGVLERYTKEQFVELTNWRPQMPRNECICTCGKKGAGVDLQVKPQAVAPAPPPVSDGSRGDRITLRAEGGFRVDFEADDEESMDVTTEVNVALESPAKRKKKKKKKRPAEGAQQAATGQTATPPTQRPAETAKPPQAPQPRPQPAQSAQAPAGEGQPARKKRRRGGRRRHGASGQESGGTPGNEHDED